MPPQCATPKRSWPSRSALLTLSAVVLSASALPAQTGVVAGTVVDTRSLRPLDAAQISVEGTSIGAVSDATGAFRLTNLSGTQVTLTIRRLGYRPATQTARVGDTEMRITLTESPAVLSQVVISGTAEPIEKRAIGNTVSKVDIAQIQQISPSLDVSSLINGRAPGVVMIGGSGAVGSGPRIRVRGAASLSLNDQPLIYVDGIRIANEVSTGPRSQFFDSGVISRLNDLDPESIESIEVIKGPAAATLYGTEANNGVIQIITRRGRAGRSVFSLTSRLGNSWFQDAAERIPSTFIRDQSGTIRSWNPVTNEEASGRDLFRNGLTQSYSGSLAGGTDVVRFNLGGTYDNDKGIEPTNHLWRWTGTANMQLSPYRNLDISTSVMTTQQSIDVPLEAGGGMWFSAYFGRFPTTPAEELRRGFFSAPPEAYWGAFKQWQDVKRTTASLQMNHRVGTWLAQRVVLGNDLTGEDNVNQTQRMSPFFRQFFTSPIDQNGNKFTRRRELSVTSADYSATVKFPVLGLNTSTSFGAQYFKRATYALAARGEGFPASGLTLVDAAALTFGGEDFFENSTLGFYAQEQVDLNNRVYVTAALRVDDNSAFGENFSWTYYPKVAATWVINEEPWWRLGWVNALKLRAAFGQTGQQPAVNSALRTYVAVTGGDGQSAVTPSSLGNSDLKPERGSEIEVGFDASLLDDRLSSEFTFYRRDTKDGILSANVAPSSGFSGTRFVNIGGIRSQGLELQTQWNAWVRDNLSLDVAFSVSRNDNEITDLGGLPFIQVGAQRNAIGDPVMSWYDFKVLSAQFDPVTKRAINAMCADGQGGATPCLNAAGQAIAPRVNIGRPDPATEGSLSLTATLWRQLRLFGLVDFKEGNKILNNNDRARCQVFGLCLANLEPENYDPVYVAQIQSPNILRNFIYQNASFARLREISASYTLPTAWAGRMRARSGTFTLSGRNLALWTPYGGTDPENFFTLQQFVRLEQAQVPQLAQIVASLALTF